ncbi:MAG: hypothetical protein KKH08_00120 [Candidatus Omnitrophica bacterium]|nr:hypothetical protein [Candidatus Omnitrophota bacterium]
MSEKLKELLNKINEEGLKRAEEKARTIDAEARKNAETTLKDAKKEANKIIENARVEASKTKESVERALKQAARDLMLSLKDEIRKTLDKIIAADAAKALSPEDIAGILKDLIEGYAGKGGKVSDIKVLLNSADLEKLNKSFTAKLKESIKSGLELKPAQNINAGFSISFDKGKSFFDFTDEGLKEALSAYLNPEVQKILK